jgi:hypothetical protein
MKISCPGCGKTYELPQTLIDAILKQHRPKPTDIDPSLFLPVEQPTTYQAAKPVAKRWSRITIAMLVITILWPFAIVVFTFVSYNNTIATAIDAGTFDGARHYLIPGRYVTPTALELLVQTFVDWLEVLTVLYRLTMTFLGVAWFATRR